MSGSELLLEYLTRYSPIMFFIVLALVFGIWTLVISSLLQPKYPEPEKLSVYECGSEPFSDARMRTDDHGARCAERIRFLAHAD